MPFRLGNAIPRSRKAWQYALQLFNVVTLLFDLFVITGSPTPVTLFYLVEEVIFKAHLISLYVTIINFRSVEYIEEELLVASKKRDLTRGTPPDIVPIDRVIGTYLSSRLEWKIWGVFKVLVLNSLMITEALYLGKSLRSWRCIMLLRTNLVTIMLTRAGITAFGELRLRWLLVTNFIWTK